MLTGMVINNSELIGSKNNKDLFLKKTNHPINYGLSVTGVSANGLSRPITGKI